MTITLTKTEAKHLLDAAGQDGMLSLPETLKATTRQRLIGRYLRDELVASVERGHELTPAGYHAIGLEPPRPARTGTKQALVIELLARGDGASIEELTAATGWLHHSTRAVLSRLRSAGTTS